MMPFENRFYREKHPRSLEEKRQRLMFWSMIALCTLLMGLACVWFGGAVVVRAEAWQCVRASYQAIPIWTDPPRIESGVVCTEWVNVHTGEKKMAPRRETS
jgi:hypothetical protein